MFPIGDDNRQINKPVAVYIIVALNALSWFFLQGAGSSHGINLSACLYGLIPAELFTSALDSGRYGACGIGNGSGWAGILSSMFMHGGWMHIIGNMTFLVVFGGNVEDSMGSVRFAVFYLLCGLCAAAAQVLAQPDSVIPMIGASGAIGGVMGAYIMLYPKVKVRVLVLIMIIRVPAVAMLGFWFVMQTIGGLSALGGNDGGGVAFWAHVGGFIGGMVLVWAFKDEELLLNHPFRGWNENEEKVANIWDNPDNRQ
ncbi:MAG: membrane associated rhomboid family serine protease [Hyphomicrobiaceae bacterium]|jgi:membrane associated rhomboid family serine protease